MAGEEDKYGDYATESMEDPRKRTLEWMKRTRQPAASSRPFRDEKIKYKKMPLRSFDDVVGTYYGGDPGFQARYDMMKGASTRAQEEYKNLTPAQASAKGILHRGETPAGPTITPRRGLGFPMSDWSKSGIDVPETKWDFGRPGALAAFFRRIPSDTYSKSQGPNVPAHINYYRTVQDDAASRRRNAGFLDQPGAGLTQLSRRSVPHEWGHYLQTDRRGESIGDYIGNTYGTKDTGWPSYSGEFLSDALVHKLEDQLGKYRPPQYADDHELQGFSGKGVQDLIKWKADTDKSYSLRGWQAPQYDRKYDLALKLAKEHRGQWDERRARMNQRAKRSPGTYKMTPEDVDRVYDKIMLGKPFQTRGTANDRLNYLKTLSPKDREEQIRHWKYMIPLARNQRSQPDEPGMFTGQRRYA